MSLVIAADSDTDSVDINCGRESPPPYDVTRRLRELNARLNEEETTPRKERTITFDEKPRVKNITDESDVTDHENGDLVPMPRPRLDSNRSIDISDDDEMMIPPQNKVQVEETVKKEEKEEEYDDEVYSDDGSATLSDSSEKKIESPKPRAQSPNERPKTSRNRMQQPVATTSPRPHSSMTGSSKSTSMKMNKKEQGAVLSKSNDFQDKKKPTRAATATFLHESLDSSLTNEKRREDSDRAYADWLKQKSQQVKQDRFIENRKKREESEGFYAVTAVESERAFKQWLRKKNRQARADQTYKTMLDKKIAEESRRIRRSARRRQREAEIQLLKSTYLS